jgi:HPr kinase/phosphorylase
MSDALSAKSLYEALRGKLGLQWCGGRAGESRALSSPERGGTPTPLVGRLNFIHPHPIQVLGRPELQYLKDLGKNSLQDALHHVFSEKTLLVLIADGQSPPRALGEAADRADVPLFSSRLPAHELVMDLQYYLSSLMAETVTLHGVFMEVMGNGLLLTGGSGTGKSELALELITRNHRLVADDAPQFARIAPDIINGSCPEMLQDFLEVRGLGLLNIRAMFGDSAIKRNKYLRLIIRLEPMNESQLLGVDRLMGSRRTRTILGLEIPEVTLPVAPGRNLAVLTEAAVRNHSLILNGYDAAREFSQRQQQFMDEGGA